MLIVHELSDVAHPSQLRHSWDSLWSRTPRASIRQTTEFLEDQTVSTGDRWRIFQVSAWDRPIGLMPLQERLDRKHCGTFRTLSLPKSDWGCCPGPVGPHAATTVSAVVRHLVTNDSSWDVLELPEVVEVGKLASRTPRAFEASGATAFQRNQQSLRGLELPAHWGQFWTDRDAAARRRWQELDELAGGGVVQLVRFRPEGATFGNTDRHWKMLGWLDRVANRQPNDPHADRSRNLLARLRETHANAVDAGCADVAVLLMNSQPMAFAYNSRCQSRIETLQLLADPQWPDAANLLIGHMLRDEIERGDTWHTFLPNSMNPGSVDWSLWQTTQLIETTITHYRRSTLQTMLQRWMDGGVRVA